MKPIILFDGVCNLCNGFVDFVIRRDPSKRFKLGSLQESKHYSETSSYALPADGLESILLLKEGKVYRRSGAVLRVAGGLRFPWPILTVLLLVPPFIRDAVYAWIAKNRYRWFGKREGCRLPTPQERERFLV